MIPNNPKTNAPRVYFISGPQWHGGHGGARYTDPSEPPSLMGVIIGKDEYIFKVSLTGKIRAELKRDI